MPSASLTFYLANTRMAQHAITFTTIVPSNSRAYFCRSCGDIWGRVVVQGTSTWDFVGQPCERHVPAGVLDWACVPGSFLGSMTYPQDHCITLTNFPRAVLLREFHLHIKHFMETRNVEE